MSCRQCGASLGEGDRFCGECGVWAREDSELLRIGREAFLSAMAASRPSTSLLSVAGMRMARTPARIPFRQPRVSTVCD